MKASYFLAVLIHFSFQSCSQNNQDETKRILHFIQKNPQDSTKKMNLFAVYNNDTFFLTFDLTKPGGFSNQGSYSNDKAIEYDQEFQKLHFSNDSSTYVIFQHFTPIPAVYSKLSEKGGELFLSVSDNQEQAIFEMELPNVVGQEILAPSLFFKLKTPTKLISKVGESFTFGQETYGEEIQFTINTGNGLLETLTLDGKSYTLQRTLNWPSWYKFDESGNYIPETPVPVEYFDYKG